MGGLWGDSDVELASYAADWTTWGHVLQGHRKYAGTPSLFIVMSFGDFYLESEIKGDNLGLIG